jgi:hypothetical protein
VRFRTLRLRSDALTFRFSFDLGFADVSGLRDLGFRYDASSSHEGNHGTAELK